MDARRGPVDPRLLRYARESRWFFVVGAVIGGVQTLAMIGAAYGATHLIVGLIDGSTLEQLRALVWLFLAMTVLRAVTTWALDAVSTRAGARVISTLRVRLVDAIARLGAGGVARIGSTRVATVVGHGLDALEGYFSRYLPQLILTIVATPLVLLALASLDLTTAIIVVVTLPIIPLFMVLIGWATEAVQRTQWTALTKLASGFLETVNGLSTLTIFGRQHRQAERVEAVTEQYRSRTMAVLRVSFLSSFVLELAGSLSVALVAVSIGVRLVSGELPLEVGLLALLLTPEAYAPLRQVGAQFHASADGAAAAEDAFEILDAAPPAAPMSRRAVRSRSFALELDGVSVSFGERHVLSELTARFEPGRMTVIAGPSGSGKSTLIGAILGLGTSSGTVSYGSTALTAATARELVAWTGQRADLMAGTVAENIALGAGGIDDVLLGEAMRLAAADLIDPSHVLGVGGSGLSGGQSQRVAVARAFYRALDAGSPVLVLDEPSAALDAATEADLIRGIRSFADLDRIVVVVSHRAVFLDAADAVIELRRGLVLAR